ncbi:hypothetical protein GGS23DRAFT_278280 [Durotheca rogersii]|uniref:uncharacterized protein n=1 Tax=Durotheca rogersii TaxID=419775 RepID=UPI0022210019|nr:uncharacterized protein GGS23DRAFT_278280 [Durotheca rogersii]KAI5866584.1 hypothetical protein GGS23DRAFT_278280 [Durotheca rogersii]
MFSDSELNSAKTTLTNLYHAFSGTATKMWAYARCLPPSKQPPAALAIRTISDLVAVAYQMLVSKTRKARHPGYACDIKRLEICWLVYNAFHAVLARKQSNYGETLAWLGVQIGKLRLRKDIRHGRVVQLVAGGCI